MDVLARMAERIERAALEDLHEAASPEVRSGLGLRRETIGGVLVSIAPGDPTILLNRAIGLGIDEPATPDLLRAIAGAYSDAGVGRFYLHVHPEARPETVWEWLPEAGFERGRGWMKFRRAQLAAPAPRADFDIGAAVPRDAGIFGRIVREGFGLSEASEPLFAALVGRPRWKLYLAFADGAPAGAAALFLHDRAAWFDWAATLRDFRGRGVQNALLCRRIADALAEGCRALFTETGEAVPGDPQHSYRNIIRAGFEPMHLRENFVPRPPAVTPSGSPGSPS